MLGVSRKKTWVTLKFLDWETTFRLVSFTALRNTGRRARLGRMTCRWMRPDSHVDLRLMGYPGGEVQISRVVHMCLLHQKRNVDKDRD